MNKLDHFEKAIKNKELVLSEQ
ncbi:DUF6500 family protein [Acinetobacter seifertii]